MTKQKKARNKNDAATSALTTGYVPLALVAIVMRTRTATISMTLPSGATVSDVKRVISYFEKY